MANSKATRNYSVRIGRGVVCSARVAHHHVAKRPHAYLVRRSKHYRAWHNHPLHKPVHFGVAALTAVLTVMVVVHTIQPAHASSSWSQTDWSGGTGSSTTNQYSSATNATTSTANQVTLSQQSELFSNTNFASDTSSWNEGVLPNSISGLKIWLKADAITGLSDGGSVGTWSDQSGNGTDETQATSANRPTYKTNIINGLPVVRFNGSTQYMESSTFSGTVTDKTLIAVTSLATDSPTGTSAGEGIIGIQSHSSDAFDSLSFNEYTANRWQNGSSNWLRTPNTIPSSNETSTSPLIMEDRQTTNDFKLYRNGSQLTSTASYSPVGQTNGSFIVGNRVNGAYYGQTLATNGFWNGDAAEIMVYNSALSTSQRQGVEAYLQGKYGISAGAATITRDTGTTYNGATASAKVVNGSNAQTFTQTVNVGNTNPYILTAYAYTTGAAVTSSDVQLIDNGSLVTTTYTSMGSGWYKLTGAVTGVAASQPYGVQVQANKTVYLDGMSLRAYATTGSITSNIFDTGVASNYGNLTYAATSPANTTVSVLVRAGNQANLSDASAFTSCSPVASGSDITSSCAPDTKRYVQYKVNFTSDGSATPTFTSNSIAYVASDVTTPPTNASSLAMFYGNGGASIASNGWTNANPYFTWTAGADDAGGSGILGYCLYLGQDSTGNPVTAKGNLGNSPISTNGACPFAVSTAALDTSLSGYIGTALTSSTSPYYLNIKAIDNADNIYNGSSAQFQFRYDNTQPANPSFITAPSEFVSSDQVNLTWPTSGSDAASDATSGVAGLQYRIGSSGTWYGTNHSGTQSSADLLPNNGSYTTIPVPDYSNLQQGNNIVYFRTWDTAGNVSQAYVTTVIKLNSTAPSSPQNLTASPTTNTTNSFGFSWLAPATFTGSAGNITYCYTVNVLPNSSNCTYTTAGQTSLDAGAYATEPGDNTFYLVAKDEAGNINYATASSTTFTANTPAPGVPLNIDIADISVKASSTWKLAVSWEPPSSVGAGISTYKVFRSTNNATFTNVANTAGASYVDTGLSQQAYYYKVEACDSANNCGAPTDVVHMVPTGKFTSPAGLTSGPNVTPTTRTAAITWTTDRASDSSVEYGLSSGHYFTTQAATSDQVTNHTLTLNNLQAGTTYYYRALWTDIDGNQGTSAESSFTTRPAPSVSNVVTGNINLHAATIQFTSSNATAIQLQYGGGVLSTTQNLNTSTNTSTYSIPLSGLTPGTTYTFKLNPSDSSGNLYDSTESHTFTTPPQPTITNVEFQPVPGALSGTEQISWTTNVPASSQISYGLVGGTRQNQLDPAATTTHAMTVSDLTYNTEYSVTATSVDNLGNVAASDLQIFKSGIDTRPPTISNVTIQPSIIGTGASAAGQLIVSWKTDKTGTSQVAYGQGAGGDYSTKTSENTSLVTNHVVVVSGLATSQVYHVQVVSSDAEGVRGVSPDETTIVGQASDSALSIVFNALQAIFGLGSKQ